jgi:acyl carrier protein
MTSTEALHRIIEALAVVWAKSASDIAEDTKGSGLEAIVVSSHEVVAVLFLVQSATGIDPSDRNVLKGCNLQNLQQLVTFVAAQAVTP